jgi:adenylate cyclase class 2
MKNKSGQEIEVKFYVIDLNRIHQKLMELQAQVVQERVFETNLRFDQPDRSLQKQRQVLRLRKDTQNILTFKGAEEEDQAVSVRQEIEVLVDDFETTRHLLELLGYRVFMEYEKYRSTYSYHDCLVVLDELPYGSFVEIEGPDGKTIQKAAKALKLQWETRVTGSYIALFENLKEHQPDFEGKMLVFSAFAGRRIMPDELKVHPADLAST